MRIPGWIPVFTEGFQLRIVVKGTPNQWAMLTRLSPARIVYTKQPRWAAHGTRTARREADGTPDEAGGRGVGGAEDDGFSAGLSDGAAEGGAVSGVGWAAAADADASPPDGDADGAPSAAVVAAGRLAIGWLRVAAAAIPEALGDDWTRSIPPRCTTNPKETAAAATRITSETAVARGTAGRRSRREKAEAGAVALR